MRGKKFGMTAVALGTIAGMLVATSLRAEVPLSRISERLGIAGGVIAFVPEAFSPEEVTFVRGRPFVVQVLTTDMTSGATWREMLLSTDLPEQVSVADYDGVRLPYVDRFVNLLVVDRVGRLSAAECRRVVAPLGGIAVPEDAGALRRSLEAAGDEFRGTMADYALYRKPWPESLDEWPHAEHGPDNNAVAADREVGPPARLQWTCRPFWSKHHERYPPTIPSLVSSAGRVFYFEDETPPAVFNVRADWYLLARDAFNGVLLWKRSAPAWEPVTWPGDMGGGLSGGPIDYRRRMVAVGDRIYVTLDYHGPVEQLDAATGRTLRTYPGTASDATEIVYALGTLFVACKNADGTFRILRLNPDTGEVLWEAEGGNGIAVSERERKVFFLAGNELGALDAVTGKRLWRVSPLEEADDVPVTNTRGRSIRARLYGPLRTGEGIVLTCADGRGHVLAVSSKDGRYLWSFRNQGFRSFFRPVTAWFIDGLVWCTQEGIPDGDVADDYFAVGLDPQTGEIKRRVPCGAVWNCGHHQRCYPTKATEQFLIFSRRGAEFLSLDDAEVTLNNWIRGTCGYGVMPANGLLYAPPHSCRCYSEVALRGLNVLASKARGPVLPQVPAERLTEGPAFGRTIDAVGVQVEDWPTFRHDAARSGGTSARIPDTLRVTWEHPFDTTLTTAVGVGDTLYVAESRRGVVDAIDVASGRVRWRFATSGPIDSPPTYAKGRLLVGCRDGYVYALTAKDGELIWRFRAAPHDVRNGGDGRIESVWPVHGSVLVVDDTAYFAAGRNSFVDGGLDLYGIDVTTGEVRYRYHYEGPDTGAGFTRENPGRGFVMPGALSDVLVADDEALYMRHLKFDRHLEQAVDMKPNFYPAPVRQGEEFGGDHKFWCDLLEVGPRAFVGRPEWDYRSYFNNFPGKRLYSTTGLLDPSWHIRSYWSYGQIVGQNIVFEGDEGYAAVAYPNAARWAAFQAGQGYVVYKGKTAVPKPGEKLYALRREERIWQATVPVRPVAMCLTADALLVAGPPDSSDPEEATAALEGKRGGILLVLDREDGSIRRRVPLSQPPVNDGVLVLRCRVFLVTVDGKLVCLDGE
ncbi:hypothetical protein JCM19992_27820 [Thermostilla marina]